MCGLGGAISFDPQPRRADPDPDPFADVAALLLDGLAHRGPDGHGVAHVDDPACRGVLAHRRLAVIDPDPRSDQPFPSPDGRLTLVFNGEIFNYRQLRDELSPRDWRTGGDTEVLLAAYERWGGRCCDRLEGMFAFAVLDRREPGRPRLFLARDAAGEKPLFVALAREDACDPAGTEDALAAPGRVRGVLFSSELTPLRRAARRLNDDAGLGWHLDLGVEPWTVQDYLAWGYVPGGRTIHRGVHKLLPGHCLTVAPGGAARRRFFDAAAPPDLDGPDRWGSAVGLTRALVGRAVARRLVSDVPVGCLLSGGIDSSVVAYEMARRLPGVRTFAVGFDDDPRYDESPHAAAVARHLGTTHRELRVSAASLDVAGELPRLARAFGEPFADSSAVPARLLGEFARGHVTVALGGDGGDEVFGGYDRYRALAMTGGVPPAPGAAAAAVGRAMGRVRPGHAKSRWSRARRLLATLGEGDAGRYGGYVRLMSRPEIAWLVPAGTSVRADVGRVAGRWFDAYRDPARGPAAAAAALDRVTYLPGDLLAKVDRCSMLHGLEVRSPFVDRDLLRLAGRLTDADLLAGGRDGQGGRGGRGGRGKRLLRDAYAHALPASVFRRPKSGFAVPIAAWLRGPLREMLGDLLFADDAYAAAHLDRTAVRLLFDGHQSGATDAGAKLYALLMLELWWREARGDL